MPKALTPHCNFNGGELSPLLMGRFDQAKYANAVKFMENWMILQGGGAMFKPGTIYAGSVKTPANKTKLMRFSFSTTQNYIVEVGDNYFRFWANNGQVLSGATPVEVATPYAIGDVFTLHRTQDQDTMYITSVKYAPYKLQRTSATAFTMTKVNFIRGPFLDANITKLTITPSAATGNTTLTVTIPAWASGNAYVAGPDTPDYVTNGGNKYRCLITNNSGAIDTTFAADLAAGYWVLDATPTIFQAGHVGSLWGVHNAVVKIISITNGLVAVGSVQNEPGGVVGNTGGTTAYTDWAEGAFSGVRGYPATCVFHEQRLYYAATSYQPQTAWGSYIDAYDEFKTDANDDAAAVTFTVADTQVNAIRWLASCPSSLQAGTSGGTFTVSSGTAGATISAANIVVNNDTNLGVAAIQSEKISSYLYYLQSSTYQLRELYYNYLVNRQLAVDMTLFAEHILRTGGGGVEIAHQQSPSDRIWVVRADGQLALLSRNPDQEIIGWSRFVSGSTSGGAGLYESIAIIPVDGGDDQIWVIVKRIVNGAVVRYVEYFSPERFTYQWEPVRLDCALQLNNKITMTGFTNASPCVVTAPSHGLSNNDQIRIDLAMVAGTDAIVKAKASPLNGNIYLVANVTTHTFSITDGNGAAIDSTLFGTYLSGGYVWKMVTAITGLTHLAGETVSAVTDGAIPAATQTFLVSPTGTITLSNPAAVVTVGLPYDGTIQLLKLTERGQSMTRRIYEAYLRVDNTLGVKIGKDINSLQAMETATPQKPPIGQPVGLYTGDLVIPIDAGWATDDEILIMQTQPLPATLLCVILKSETENRE